ncbi:MAG: hypothetical protein HUU35_09680 [Armatimonadetes bacterium]|nr:hypothetical protein [Armatimonadota bacterium]
MIPPKAAKPAEPAPPTVSGVWVLPRADGGADYLEIYGKRRFIYRSGDGLVAGGQAEVAGNRLVLQGQESRRAFVYELESKTLRLIPDADDRPADETDLGRMAPRGGDVATWQRRGALTHNGKVPIESAADLLGTFVYRGAPGREEQLVLLPDGAFRYRGPDELAADGSWALTDEVLELSDGLVTRRLTPVLRFDAGAWRLDLTRHESEATEPASDLADLPPAYHTMASYTRASPPLPADFTGRYEITVAGVRHRLLFTPGGQLRYVRGTQIVPGEYQVDGSILTIALRDAEGEVERRRLLAELLPDGLLLVRLPDQHLAVDLLAELPPVSGAVARYRTW